MSYNSNVYGNLNFLAPGWRDKLCECFSMPQVKQTLKDLKNRVHYLPDKTKIFLPFSIGDFDQVRVVIVGQDPYCTPGLATGLAFAVPNEEPNKPPTIRNILAEVQRNIHQPMNPAKTSLVGWAEQDVLLLNSILTVGQGKELSHEDLNWEFFIGNVLGIIAARPEPTVFMLWGATARGFAPGIAHHSQHLILEASHPSPLGANSGPILQRFNGCLHFAVANDFLAKANRGQIDWIRTW